MVAESLKPLWGSAAQTGAEGLGQKGHSGSDATIDHQSRSHVIVTLPASFNRASPNLILWNENLNIILDQQSMNTIAGTNQAVG